MIIDTGLIQSNPKSFSLRGTVQDQGSQWQEYPSSLFFMITRAFPTRIRLDCNWPDRLCLCALEPLYHLYFRCSRYSWRLTMPSFLTVIFAGSESFPRQRRSRLAELSFHHVQPQEKGLPWPPGSLRPSYELDFPACNVQNIPPCFLPYLAMPPHSNTPCAWQTSFLLCICCLHQPSLASCRHRSLHQRFSHCGREGVNTRFCVYACIYVRMWLRQQ